MWQGKVVGLISSSVQKVLQQAAASVKTDTGRISSVDDPEDTVSSALACVKFRAAVEPQLMPILEALDARREKSPEVDRLLETLEAAFCSVRVSATLPRVQKHIAHLQVALSLREQARCATFAVGCSAKLVFFHSFWASGVGEAFLALVAVLQVSLFHSMGCVHQRGLY